MTANATGLSELNRLSSRLWQMRDLQSGLDEMLEGTIALLGADMGNIQLLDESRQALIIRAHCGFEPAFLAFFHEVSADNPGACGRALRTGRRTVIADVETDEPYTPLRPTARAAGYRGVVSTPLIGRTGRPVGMMSAHFRSPHRPDEQKLGLLDLYARQAADFIERLQADATLRQSEQRYRALITASSEVAYKMSADWSLMYPLDGRSLVVSNSEPIRNWLTLNVPTEEHSRVRARIDEAIADKSLFQLEHQVLRPDGSLGWTFSRAVPILDENDELVEWFGTAADITDRKRAEEALREREERFRQMADTMAHMIWVTRPDGYHEWYNRRWYEFTGVSEGSTDGEGWNAMFHPDDQARAWATWQHSLDSGRPYEMEYRLRHHTGEYRWVLGRALPIRNNRSEIERWFGTCTDIHAMRQLVDEREHLLQSEQAARVESERASRMKDEFLATLSHEIRTPLNAILGWATMLRSGQVSGDGVAQGLEVIERNARVQTQMIEDLLDMSRIISGKLRLDVQPIDLAQVIRAAVETLQPAARAKEIRVHLALDPSTPPVSGDPNRLQQVFWNLLSNSIKFTPGGGRVQVLLERIDSHVEVRVADTGEGIDPAFLSQVFDRFRQADSTPTRRHGGLGLGLAIVKQLMELHGGTVRAHSAGTDQGATFITSLPLTVMAPEVEELPSGLTTSEPSTVANRRLGTDRRRPSTGG